MPTYFLGFDSHLLSSSFSYIVKNALILLLKKKRIPYTFSITDSFDQAIFPSAEDCQTYYPALAKKNIPYSILALDSFEDIHYTKRGIFLTQNAFNGYKKAEEIHLFYPSQEKFLKANGVTPKKITYWSPFLSIDPTREISSSEKNAFRSYYQVDPKRKVIVAFGSYDSPYVKQVESLARMNPNCDFLFFGRGESKGVRMSLLNNLVRAPNISYLRKLPEELYPSMLVSVDAAVFLQGFLVFPSLLFDLMAYKVPIISYRNDAFPELIQEKTALIPNDFTSLYQSIRFLDQNNRKEEAHDFLVQCLKEST